MLLEAKPQRLKPWSVLGLILPALKSRPTSPGVQFSLDSEAQRAGMHEVFDEEEFQPAEQRRDTELTLGPMLLLGLFFGLVLLCGLCFGVGYSMGSRSAHDSPATGQQPGAGAAMQAAGSLPKPSATPQNISQKPQPALADLPPFEAHGANPGAGSQNSGPASASGAYSTQPLVKPALPASATAPTPA